MKLKEYGTLKITTAPETVGALDMIKDVTHK